MSLSDDLDKIFSFLEEDNEEDNSHASNTPNASSASLDKLYSSKIGNDASQTDEDEYDQEYKKMEAEFILHQQQLIQLTESAKEQVEEMMKPSEECATSLPKTKGCSTL